MIDGREDQAAGLRRLFRKAPPTVVALFSTGRYARASAAYAIKRIGHQAHRVLLLDEAIGENSLASIWGHKASGDLLHVLDDRCRLESLLQPVEGLMGRLPVSAAAMALPLLDDARRERLIDHIRALQRRSRFMLVHASPISGAVPSPFVFAAPRRLLVAEASHRGATEAFTCIKSLSANGAGSIHVAVAQARDRDDAKAFFHQLETLVHACVGIPMRWVGEIERDDLAEPLLEDAGVTADHDAEAAFLRRLQGWRHNAEASAPR